jgi:anti-sigma regulatory factor (Ser/Thr protein kinase)
MLVGRTGEWSTTFPAAASSVPSARRFLQELIGGSVPPDCVETAQLCLSELVTNAVLHAGSPLQVTVMTGPDTVRLEVHDTSTVIPQRIPHTPGSTTGRGLGLVEVLSRAWGVDPAPRGGKVVWCVLPVEVSDSEDALSPAWDQEIAELLGGEVAADPGEAAAPVQTSSSTVAQVHLLRYPVRRGVRTREHFEALRRECQLLQFTAPEALRRTPQRLLEMAGMLAGRYAVELAEPERRKLDAFARGEETVDLAYPLRPEAAAMVRSWQEVLTEMDALCEKEGLLTLAAAPDVVELRTWVLEEFLRQIAGAPPQPWPGPVD